MATTVVIDFETAACLRDPLEAAGHRTSGRLRASSVFATTQGAVVAVDVDPCFRSTVDALAAAGTTVVVVSDGVGSYAEDACAALPVLVYANGVDPATGALTFPHAHLSCACSTCGICKQALLKDARRRGAATVLVSGRLSDHKAALLASRVLARGELAEWCAAAGVEHTVFVDMAAVGRTLTAACP